MVLVGGNICVCLVNELRCKTDESEPRRRDFKSTPWLLPKSLPAAIVDVNEEQSGCEAEGRMSGKKALREYLRVLGFDESLIVGASSDVNKGV